MTLFQKKKLQKKITSQGTLNDIVSGDVNKVVENIRNQNKAAFYFYSNNLMRRRSFKESVNLHYVLSGHPLNGFSEEWDGNISSEYFEEFNYRSLMPSYITPIRNIEKSDPVTGYIKIKDSWIYEMQNHKRTIYNCDKLKEYEELNNDVIRCPRVFVDMAITYENDPDPYFTTPYNWYYSGNGNFHMISLNSVDYLLYSEFNYLYLSHFSRHTCNIDINDKPIFDCGEDVNILETIFSSQNIIVLRTMKKVFILKIIKIEPEAVVVEKVKTIESKLPYTSVNFDSHHKNILYVTTLDDRFSIINLDRMTANNVRSPCSLNNLINNWNTIIGAERSYYTVIKRQMISIYDKRTNKTVCDWSKLRNVTDEMLCNHITVAKQREGSSALYFGTDHHVFKMDMRYQSRFKLKPVQRWTHGMECVPTYMTISEFEENKELLCLSSQWCEDMCVLSNYTDKYIGNNMKGVTIPYRPPHIFNTLDKARKNLLCLNLYNKSYSRLSTAITGTIMYKQDEKYVILMQNSLGDVTSHMLYPAYVHEYMEDDSFLKLEEWCESYKNPNNAMEVSAIVDLSNFWKKLRRVPNNHSLLDSELLETEELVFNEKEIHDTFDNEEVDSALSVLWLKDKEKKESAEQSAQHIYFSNDE